MWITSKLWNTYHAREHVRPAFERSLRDLQLEYLDLYLIHFPLALKYVPIEKRYPPGWFYDPDSPRPSAEEAAVPIHETWRAMEDLVRSGLVRNIGVSNFNIALLRDLLASAEIEPSVLQVELHPYLTQEKLLRFCGDRRIAVTAFSPLGAASYVELGMAGHADSALQQPAVQQAAAQHGKTPSPDPASLGHSARHGRHPQIDAPRAPPRKPGDLRLRAVRGRNARDHRPQPQPPLQRPRRLRRKSLQHLPAHLRVNKKTAG